MVDMTLEVLNFIEEENKKLSTKQSKISGLQHPDSTPE